MSVSGIQYNIIEVAQIFSDNIKFIAKQRGNRTESSGNMKKMAELGWKSKINLKNYIYNLFHRK